MLFGSGLMNLYLCLCELCGVILVWSSIEVLIGVVCSGEDVLVVEML